MNPSKRTWLRIGIFVFLVTGAYFANVALQSHLGRKTLAASGLEIHTLDEALRLAKVESRPILTNVSAIWCPSCRTLDKQVLSDDRVKQKLAEKYLFARLEYESEEGKTFQAKHGLVGFPNLVILDAQGKLVRKLPLSFEPETFLQQL